MKAKIVWVDGGREPRNRPNPKYPKGIDIDASDGKEPACTTPLPYPAKRCGHFVVECETCGHRAIVTTAGRKDDPRSLKVACKRPLH